MPVAMRQDLFDCLAPTALPICHVSVPLFCHVPKALAGALIVLMNNEGNYQASTSSILIVGNFVKQEVKSKIVRIEQDAIYTLGRSE
jgi:hypothetical protein